MTVDNELFGDQLPTYLTRFVGREQEIADVRKLLGTARLVTICGIGGSGKTRLAIEVAKRLRSESRDASFADAVYWVPLSAVTDPIGVPSAAAGAIRPGSGGDATTVIVSTIRDRPALLVLDNCDDVTDACCRLLNNLLSWCPKTDRVGHQPVGTESGRGTHLPDPRHEWHDWPGRQRLRSHRCH
jgi:hypothetical protein